MFIFVFVFVSFVVKSLCDSIDKIQGLDKQLKCKIVQYLKECSDWRNHNVPEIDSPYTGISHCDLWTNNIMFKRGKK